MRFLWLVWLTQGCAYISDKHEDWRLDPDDDGVGIVEDCDNNDASVGAERAVPGCGRRWLRRRSGCDLWV